MFLRPEALLISLCCSALCCPLQVNPSLSVGAGLLVELLITFQLLLTICATCDPKRNDLKGSAAMAIGLSVCTGHLFAVSMPLAGQLTIQHLDNQTALFTEGDAAQNGQSYGPLPFIMTSRRHSREWSVTSQWK